MKNIRAIKKTTFSILFIVLLAISYNLKDGTVEPLGEQVIQGIPGRSIPMVFPQI